MIFDEELKKHTLKEFWDYWSDGQNKVMEVRIKDFKWIKNISDKMNIPYSKSGVMVDSYDKLREVIGMARNHTTMWFGINPKRKSYENTQYGLKKVYGGKDVNVESIDFIFIDIDRYDKQGTIATDEDLKKINDFADMIISDMEQHDMRNFCKIYSGNGIQIIYKLDGRLQMPNLKYDMEKNFYLPDDRYEKYKDLIRTGFASRLITKYNTTKNKNEYGCEIDKACFNIGRVGALPFTYNFKFNSKIMRGILEIRDDKPNISLADSLEMIYEKMGTTITNEKRIKSNHPTAKTNYIYTERTIMKCPLVVYLTQCNTIPYGGVNNALFFALKMILIENGFSLDSSVALNIKRLVELNLKTKIGWNHPGEGKTFHIALVNNWCMDSKESLIFEPYPDGIFNNNFDINKYDWERYKYLSSDFYEKNFNLNIGQYENRLSLAIDNLNKELYPYQNERNFMHYCYGAVYQIEKAFGEDIAKFAFDNYLTYYWKYIMSLYELNKALEDNK